MFYSNVRVQSQICVCVCVYVSKCVCVLLSECVCVCVCYIIPDSEHWTVSAAIIAHFLLASLYVDTAYHLCRVSALLVVLVTCHTPRVHVQMLLHTCYIFKYQ